MAGSYRESRFAGEISVIAGKFSLDNYRSVGIEITEYVIYPWIH